MSESFSSRTAAELAGISFRQLDYWARTDLVRPSLAEATGSGSRRRYSPDDVLGLTIVNALLEAGIKLESVRLGFHELHRQVSGATTGYIVIGGGQAVVARDDHELLAVLKAGQFVMISLLSLDAVRGRVATAIRDHLERDVAAA